MTRAAPRLYGFLTGTQPLPTHVRVTTAVSWDFMDQVEIFEEHDFSRMFLHWTCRAKSSSSLLQRLVLGEGLASSLSEGQERNDLIVQCRGSGGQVEATRQEDDEAEDEEEQKHGEVGGGAEEPHGTSAGIARHEHKQRSAVVHCIGESARRGRIPSCSRVAIRPARPPSLVKNDSGFALEVDASFAKRSA